MKDVYSQHIVIIGAGFGGLKCAQKLAKNKNLRVTLIDKHNHHLFQPLLYQIATATLSAPDIARSIRGIFSCKTNIDVRYNEVTQVSLEDKKVYFSNEESQHYDFLVLATGTRSSFFGNDQWVSHVHQLKSLQNALDIRKDILRNLELADQDSRADQQALSTVVIVGGGPSGVELAGAFADLIKRNMCKDFKRFDTSKQRIILLEAQEHLLGMFDRSHSKYTKQRLIKLGVEVRMDARVSDIQDSKVLLSCGEVAA